MMLIGHGCTPTQPKPLQVPQKVINRVLMHCDLISPAYGEGIRAARAQLSGTQTPLNDT